MKILAIVLALFVMATALSAGAERPQTYGFSLPYPVQLPDLVPAGNVPFLTSEKLVTVIVDIDRSGKVVGVAAEAAEDARFASHFSEYLEAVRFEPAVREGEKVDARLPVILQYRLKARMPDVFFPVDTALTIANRELYFQAFNYNGYQFPQIDTFPSYFSDLEWHDSSLTYPYMILGLNLDTTGRVTAADKIFASDPSFVDQVLSASLWAKFMPAQFDGRPMASRCFLIVSQYPHTSYPTHEWRLADSSQQTYLESQQLRLIPDTVGLLSVPILRLYPGDEVKFGGRFAKYRDTVVAAIRVDAAGSLSVPRLGSIRKNLRNELMKLLRGLKFFPSVDYQGQPHSMHGLAKITLTGSGIVRIEYFWLSP